MNGTKLITGSVVVDGRTAPGRTRYVTPCAGGFKVRVERTEHLWDTLLKLSHLFPGGNFSGVNGRGGVEWCKTVPTLWEAESIAAVVAHLESASV